MISTPEVSIELLQRGDDGPVLEGVEFAVLMTFPNDRKQLLLLPGIGEETAEIEPRPTLLPALLPGDGCSICELSIESNPSM